MTLEPGHGMPGGYGSMRSSTADRERAIDVLKAAFAEGRLSRDEFVDRSERVYRSLTYAELAALTADLPAGPLGALAQPGLVYPAQLQPPVPYPAAPRRPVNSLAVAALICSFIPGFPAAAAVITGIVARRQIRESGERGDGVASVAIVIGMISLVGFLLYLAAHVGLA
jgi:uncharacterized protein DUF1707/uncharacterized protein DUF4190